MTGVPGSSLNPSSSKATELINNNFHGLCFQGILISLTACSIQWPPGHTSPCSCFTACVTRKGMCRSGPLGSLVWNVAWWGPPAASGVSLIVRSTLIPRRQRGFLNYATFWVHSRSAVVPSIYLWVHGWISVHRSTHLYEIVTIRLLSWKSRIFLFVSYCGGSF